MDTASSTSLSSPQWFLSKIYDILSMAEKALIRVFPERHLKSYCASELMYMYTLKGERLQPRTRQRPSCFIRELQQDIGTAGMHVDSRIRCVFNSKHDPVPFFSFQTNRIYRAASSVRVQRFRGLQHLLRASYGLPNSRSNSLQPPLPFRLLAHLDQRSRYTDLPHMSE